MANFLITSPSSETVGTTDADLFDLRTSQGVTVFGSDGNDTFSAIDLAGSAVKINGGAGNDDITLTASTNGSALFRGSVFAGQGNDDITADQLFSAAIIRGGLGNDTITLQAAAGNLISKSTINGNDNADLIQGTILSGSQTALIAAGMGKDTVDLTFSGANEVSLNGGMGHDSFALSAVGSLSSVVVAGGDGKDTITFSAGAAAGISANSNINGGDLADLITFRDDVIAAAGSSTIAGNDGADTIRFSAGVGLNQGFINGGAGSDSVYISAQFSSGTLNGGAGADSITLGTYQVSGSNAGAIRGEEGADQINLGTDGTTLISGTTNISGSITLGYASFDQSNLSATDYVSAGFTLGVSGGYTANIFDISQDVVTATIATNVGNAATFTATDGTANFTSTFANNVTARVEELDRILVKGQTVAFENGAGNAYYVFIQGGSSSGGSADDLLIQVSTAVNGFNITNNSAIEVRLDAAAS